MVRILLSSSELPCKCKYHLFVLDVLVSFLEIENGFQEVSYMLHGEKRESLLCAIIALCYSSRATGR